MRLDTHLVDRTLQLSVKDRADLARRLILGLGPAHPEAEPEADWDAMIERRLDAVNRGDVTLLEWRPAIERIREEVQVQGSECVAVAVSHLRRRPQYWRKRL